jgi:hypothetical protein
MIGTNRILPDGFSQSMLWIPCTNTGQKDTATMTGVLIMEGGLPFVLKWVGTYVGLFCVFRFGK